MKANDAQNNQATTQEAVDITTDFFAKMTAKDITGISRYIPHEGFSEVLPDSNKLLQLDIKAFEGLFQSDRQIDLRTSDVQAKLIGDTAIVTGTRVGSVTPANSTPVEGRLIFTIIWGNGADGWQLRHIHFSVPSAV